MIHNYLISLSLTISKFRAKPQVILSEIYFKCRLEWTLPFRTIKGLPLKIITLTPRTLTYDMRSSIPRLFELHPSQPRLTIQFWGNEPSKLNPHPLASSSRLLRPTVPTWGNELSNRDIRPLHFDVSTTSSICGLQMVNMCFIPHT